MAAKIEGPAAVQGVQVRTVDVSTDKAPMVLVQVPTLGTDERGEFRIVDAPGKFYLQADYQARQNNERPEIRADGGSEAVYGTTFYPAPAAKGRATVVEAIAGKDVGGLDIQLQRQRGGMSIHGTVSGIPDGSESSRATVVMRFGESAQRFSISRSTNVGADGKFSFPALPPGFYSLYASLQSSGLGGSLSRG